MGNTMRGSPKTPADCRTAEGSIEVRPHFSIIGAHNSGATTIFAQLAMGVNNDAVFTAAAIRDALYFECREAALAFASNPTLAAIDDAAQIRTALEGVAPDSVDACRSALQACATNVASLIGAVEDPMVRPSPLLFTIGALVAADESYVVPEEVVGYALARVLHTAEARGARGLRTVKLKRAEVTLGMSVHATAIIYVLPVGDMYERPESLKEGLETWQALLDDPANKERMFFCYMNKLDKVRGTVSTETLRQASLTPVDVSDHVKTTARPMALSTIKMAVLDANETSQRDLIIHFTKALVADSIVETFDEDTEGLLDFLSAKTELGSLG